MDNNKIMVEFYHNNNETSADELQGNLYEHEQNKEMTMSEIKTKDDVTKDTFQEFVDIQMSGEYNMAGSEPRYLLGLDKSEYKVILKNYEYLFNLHNPNVE